MNKRQYLMIEAIMTAPEGITREEINNSKTFKGFILGNNETNEISNNKS